MSVSASHAFQCFFTTAGRATFCGGSAGVSGVLANRFTEISLNGGLLLGACVELSGAVAYYAASFFSNDGAISRTAIRVARVIGGHYLGNMALQAAGFAPLAFGPATVIIPLMAPVVMVYTLNVISDLWKATLGNLMPARAP